MKTSTFLKSLFCCILLLFTLQAKLQIITTVAGNGSGGYSGDSGLALNASVSPWNVTFDSHHNMFIVDYDHAVIRKVNASTGIITTVAGNGIPGFSGDNGLAAQAQLNKPFDAVADSSGNIYIADLANYRIRKIDAATGIITTIAGTGVYTYSGDGGLAVNAGLKEPVGVAIDSLNKSLYILEAFGSRIRKVDLSTGIITTIAGNGIQRSSGDGGLAINAELDEPLAMTIDRHNNIYINETHYRIRKINASDGIIHTIAGTGVEGDTGDGGLATNAEIGYSFGLAVDKNNNIYLTELLASYIRKVSLDDSTITTVAGTGNFGYNGDGILATQADIGSPNGIATDSKGNFYFTDGMRVRKVTIDSSALDEIYGYAYYDLNSNNIKDSSEPFFSAGKIVSKKKSDSIVTITTGGNFRIGVDTGRYNSSFTPFKNYYNIIPKKHTSVFSDYSQIDTVHFAMQPVNGNQDVNISMYSFMSPIPGFDVPYRIRYKNEGTDTIANGVIQLIKDPRVTLVSASPSYASINGDTIRWNYTGLKPLDTASVLIYFNVPATTHIGDTIYSTASITPVENDLMPADNSIKLSQILVGSFDPNNKSESHAGSLTATQVSNGDYLYYTIRFQNTGTYAAFNIVVKDTLSNKLDWNSIEMVDASNTYQLDISGGNKCTWYFNGIGLPDSNANEPASHGYIVYRIKPKTTLTAGNIINNSAGIYFDYNQPVETNTEKTIVANITLPLQLLSFTAEHHGKANLLKWSTANEINTSYFEIQRSSDGKNFSSIGSVPASGLSKLQNTYAYNDEQPLKAMNYYRLKMTDKDGRYSYSIIRSINNTGSFDVMLYPNPVKDQLTLNFTAEKTMNIKIEVTAADGKIVFTKEMQLAEGESKQAINTAVLRAGNYFIKCTAPDEIRTLKLVKQ